MPAETEPPGELMYRKMSRVGSSAASSSSCAQMTFAIVSSTTWPRKTIRSLSSRLKTCSSGFVNALGARMTGVMIPGVSMPFIVTCSCVCSGV